MPAENMTPFDWSRCPGCGDTNIEGLTVEIDTFDQTPIANQDMGCNNCDATWTETYTALSRDNFNHG